MSYAMEEGPRPHRITVDEYHRMAEVGLLAPDARVELIEGVIIDMAPIGPPHCSAVDLLTELLVLAVSGRAIVRTQGSVRLNRWSEPQPDIAVLKSRLGRYRQAHPSGKDIYLVIEVSESSLKFDLNAKAKLYARYGVPEVWVADLNANVLHFFRGRTDVGYREVTSTRTPGVLEVPSLGVAIDLSKLFADE
jgi:Uma2 family endonuclease